MYRFKDIYLYQYLYCQILRHAKIMEKQNTMCPFMKEYYAPIKAKVWLCKERTQGIYAISVDIQRFPGVTIEC